MDSRTGLPAAPGINRPWGEQHWPLRLGLGNQSWGAQALCHVTTEPPIPTTPRHTNKGIVTSAPLWAPFHLVPGGKTGRAWALGCRRTGQGKKHCIPGGLLAQAGLALSFQCSFLVLSGIHRELFLKRPQQ